MKSCSGKGAQQVPPLRFATVGMTTPRAVALRAEFVRGKGACGSLGRPARTQSPVIASLAGVTKKFGPQIALDQLSLELRRGEVVALLGPNGAGKTTAIRLLLGLTRPTSGQVRIFDGNPRDRASRMRLGAMLQVGRMPETLRVREHLELFRSYYPHPRPLQELLTVAGLIGLEEKLFRTLSGGQKQRMLFALALCGDPDLICLDEPTLGMDVEARRAMWVQVRKLAADGKTILLTTHYLEEADALANRIIVIKMPPMMPKPKIRNANSPAIGRKASAACAEVWIFVMPCSCNVAAVEMMMKSATKLESAIPT